MLQNERQPTAAIEDVKPNRITQQLICWPAPRALAQRPQQGESPKCIPDPHLSVSGSCGGESLLHHAFSFYYGLLGAACSRVYSLLFLIN